MSDYLILSRDIPVAKWENNQLTVLNEQLLPLYLKRVKNADMWLATRAIDSHRANSRLLKKALRLTERDDVSTVLYVNGATITDNYWIKPIDSALTYPQIKFDNDYFSRLALKGNYDSFNRAANSKHSKTPELTNIPPQRESIKDYRRITFEKGKYLAKQPQIFRNEPTSSQKTMNQTVKTMHRIALVFAMESCMKNAWNSTQTQRVQSCFLQWCSD